jgi:hypothetical protein
MNRVIINFPDYEDDEELAVIRGSHVAWVYNREIPCERVTVTFKNKDMATCISVNPKGFIKYMWNEDGRLQKVK